MHKKTRTRSTEPVKEKIDEGKCEGDEPSHLSAMMQSWVWEWETEI